MTAEMIVVAGVVGLGVGWLAGFVMNGGGYGLMGDILLGVGGSIAGAWIFRILGFAPNGGWMATLPVAFVGAVILIYAQRTLWHTNA
jgi:uncharacterized membrane protein YeaQ/YmgE (transglycosylase-associated protein family)